jgi:gluconolactonase
MIKRWLLFTFCLSYVSAQSPLPAYPALEKIAGGFKFVEGPLWNNNAGLLFSDIHGNTIYQWSSIDSTVTAYIKPSDSSNGLAFDKQGRLILTQMAKRRIARRETDGTITPLASSYNGKRFNSPNDVVVRGDGSIFFTDPDFNIPAGQRAELPHKGVYRMSPGGALQLLDSTFNKPNGICFSPDENKMYVNESPDRKIYSWDVINDSTVAGKTLLYTIPASGYADGMKTDSAGNIYCTGPGGVWIISPAGTYLGKIATPETPTNCAWGGNDRKTLYITAGTSVYRIRMTATGVHDYGAVKVNSYKLCTNYPNPFNPSTVINYQLPVNSFVTLTIYDIVGREMEELVNEAQSMGSYDVTFKASALCTGVYFYRLNAGLFTETRKFLYLR